jgi:hypothetical protein
MMQTDVLATHLTADGTVSGNRARLKAVSYRGDGTAGSILFKNGGASGATLLELDVGTSDTFTIYLLLPGEGILFSAGIYADLTHVSAITAFYG